MLDERDQPLKSPYLSTVGRVQRHYDPAEHPDLGLRFANLDLNHNSIAEFASDFGLIDEGEMFANDRPSTDSFRLWEEEVSAARAFMQQWIAIQDSPEDSAGRLEHEAELRHFLNKKNGEAPLIATLSSRGGRTRLEIAPSKMLSAVWFQLSSAYASDVRVRQCEAADCRKFFIVGGPQGVGSVSKRKHARFCSDTCKARFHRIAKQRSQEKGEPE